MALSRRTGARFQASIWPGFVDAMTALLLVLMFVLTIFMVVQFILRETITGQESELDALSVELASLADQLGLERDRTADLQTRLGALSATLSDTRAESAERAATIAALQGTLAERDTALAEAEIRITGFEAQVAGLLAERDQALGRITELEGSEAELLSEQEQLNLAIAQARSEIDAQTEAARLAAAQREALEAMIADLRLENAATAEALSAEETARLTEAAAAEALRERLQNAQTELTAMTLALEQQRREAEETLSLLAAARAARDELTITSETQLTEVERQAALLAVAEAELSEKEAQSLEDQRKLALLNEQVAALRGQLGSLQTLLDDARARDEAAQVQLDTLGTQLNTALAQVAAEERRRRELEEAERIRLEAENQNLERYRSEFFGALRDLLGTQEGVRIEGDRFVFSSEVLFATGQARLSAEGRTEIAKVATILSEVAQDIPDALDWVIRVDGHTDNVPLSGFGAFEDNWELSQARALSVVRYMIDALGLPPDRLAANGFGQYQPVNTADTSEARAQNRRIELKLTEK